MAATLLLTLLRRSAALLGGFQTCTVAQTAIGPDPARWLIQGETRADGAPPSVIGWFVHMTSTLEVRRVRHDEPGIGALALDRVLASTATAGTEFDLTQVLPFRTTGGVTGLVPLIAEACRLVWFEDRVAFTPVAGQYEYNGFSAQAAWLDSEDKVLGIYDPAVSSTYLGERADWRFNGLSFDTGSPTLRLTRAYLGSGGTAELVVKRPGHTLVSGAESTAGPSANSAVVYADPDDIVAVTLLLAYRYLATAQHLSEEARAPYAALAQAQEERVRRDVKHYLPTDGQAQRAEATA